MKTSNKALQSTLNTSETTTSPDTKITREKGDIGAGEGGNPIQSKQIVLCFIDVMLRIYEIKRELGLKDASMLMMLMIMAMYEREKRGISQYEIAKQCFALNSTIQTYQRCKVMKGKGIIECVGMSKFRSPVYVPTIKAYNLISKHFTVKEVDYLLSTLYPLPMVA